MFSPYLPLSDKFASLFMPLCQFTWGRYKGENMSNYTWTKWRPFPVKRGSCLIPHLVGTYLCGAKNWKKVCYRIFDCREMGVEVLDVTITWTIRSWRSFTSVYMGFAKSRPAAQRPAAHGPPRPSGPAARRPSGPRPATARRPAARHGPAVRGPRWSGSLEARWPSPDFQQFFCPAVNPNACTDLHRVSAWTMDDGEFSSVPFWQSFDNTYLMVFWHSKYGLKITYIVR